MTNQEHKRHDWFLNLCHKLFWGVNFQKHLFPAQPIPYCTYLFNLFNSITFAFFNWRKFHYLKNYLRNQFQIPTQTWVNSLCIFTYISLLCDKSIHSKALPKPHTSHYGFYPVFFFLYYLLFVFPFNTSWQIILLLNTGGPIITEVTF